MESQSVAARGDGQKDGQDVQRASARPRGVAVEHPPSQKGAKDLGTVEDDDLETVGARREVACKRVELVRLVEARVPHERPEDQHRARAEELNRRHSLRKPVESGPVDGVRGPIHRGRRVNRRGVAQVQLRADLAGRGEQPGERTAADDQREEHDVQWPQARLILDVVVGKVEEGQQTADERREIEEGPEDGKDPALVRAIGIFEHQAPLRRPQQCGPNAAPRAAEVDDRVCQRAVSKQRKDERSGD